VKGTKAQVLALFIMVLLLIPGASLSAICTQAAGEVRGNESALTGVCYGPFRDGQNPNWGPYPSETDLRDDMPILTNMTGAIRTYGVSNGLDKIVPIANEFDLPVSPGAWISGYRDVNEEEIAKLITLAQTYEVESVIVGNEVVLSYEQGWDTLNETELLAYLARVKSNVSVPVTTGEPWHVWAAHPDLVEAVDYILIHVHPYWEGVPVENAAQYVIDK
jgi:exo-beta-1,3-glucanase (GH17 family)